MEEFAKYNFAITLLICEFVCAFRMPKRKYFWLFLLIGSGLTILVQFLVLKINFPTYLLPFRYFLVFLTSFALLISAYDLDVWSYLIIGTVGYSLQHIGYQAHRFILEIANFPENLWLSILFLTLTTTITLVLAYFLFLRKLPRNKRIVVSGTKQIFLSLLVVISADFMCLYGFIFSSPEEKNVHYVLYFFSEVISILAIALEMAFIKFKTDEKEIDLLRHLVHSARHQLSLSKENIDIINIKCHDLKHQIHTLKGSVDEKDLSQIENAVDIYDADIKTNNDALDTVLTEKNLLNQNDGIRMTCVIDGTGLERMSQGDIYSFFGNAIDNAREAVKSLPPEKRSISVSSFDTGSLFTVRIENYCDQKPVFIDGMPQSEKNPNYHGFGTKSMKLIAEKYGGSVSFSQKDDIFTVKLSIFRQ